MSANISRCRLILDTRRPLKDGTYPVKISVPYGKDLLIATGVSVALDEWSADGLYEGPQTKRVNAILNAQLARVTGRVQELRDAGRFRRMDASTLRKILTTDDLDYALSEGRATLLQIADKYVSLIKPGNTRKLYEITVKKIRAYIGSVEVYVEDIDRAWLIGFDAFIGGKVNARAVHLRNLRAICNFAIDEDLTEYYPFRKYKIRTEETLKKALTVQQLLAIRDLHCQPWQEEYRDIFMLFLYLIGINAVDLFNAPPDALRDGRLEYRRAKTGRLYSVKVEPEALAIIKKYRGKNYLLSPLDRYSNYKDYLHHLNNALKTLGMDARPGAKRTGRAIEPALSSNWARHTWATIAAELDVSDPTITLAMGHATAGHRVTSIYIKRNFNKNDEANRKVIDYLNGFQPLQRSHPRWQISSANSCTVSPVR